MVTKSKSSPPAKAKTAAPAKASGAPATKSKTLAASQMSKGVPKAGATPTHQRVSVRSPRTQRGN